jgi:hypothetical protein
MQQKGKQVDKGVVNPGYRGLFQEMENPSVGTSCSLIIAFNSSAEENITVKTTCTSFATTALRNIVGWDHNWTRPGNSVPLVRIFIDIHSSLIQLLY